MASSDNPSGISGRRPATLGRVVQLRRGRLASDAAPRAPDAGYERRIQGREWTNRPSSKALPRGCIRGPSRVRP